VRVGRAVRFVVRVREGTWPPCSLVSVTSARAVVVIGSACIVNCVSSAKSALGFLFVVTILRFGCDFGEHGGESTGHSMLFC
jgi:hypothetical protein